MKVDLKQSIGNKLVQAGIAHRKPAKGSKLFVAGQTYERVMIRLVEADDGDGGTMTQLIPVLPGKDGSLKLDAYGQPFKIITGYLPSSFLRDVK